MRYLLDLDTASALTFRLCLSDQDLVEIDEGIAQAERGEHVPDDEVNAFFTGWKKKFEAVNYES